MAEKQPTGPRKDIKGSDVSNRIPDTNGGGKSEARVVIERNYPHGFEVVFQSHLDTEEQTVMRGECEMTTFYTWCFLYENNDLFCKLQKDLSENHHITIKNRSYPPVVILQDKKNTHSATVTIINAMRSIVKNNINCSTVRDNLISVDKLHDLLKPLPEIQSRAVVVYSHSDIHFVTGYTEECKKVFLLVTTLEKTDPSDKADAGNVVDNMVSQSSRNRQKIPAEDDFKYADDDDDDDDDQKPDTKSSTAEESRTKLNENVKPDTGSGQSGPAPTSIKDCFPSQGTRTDNVLRTTSEEVTVQNNPVKHSGGTNTGPLRGREATEQKPDTRKPAEDRTKQTISGQGINKRDASSANVGTTMGCNIAHHGLDTHPTHEPFPEKGNVQNIVKTGENTNPRTSTNLGTKQGLSRHDMASSGMKPSPQCKDDREIRTINLDGLGIELCHQFLVVPNALSGFKSRISFSLTEHVIHLEGDKASVIEVSKKIQNQLQTLKESKHLLDPKELPQEAQNMMQYSEVMDIVSSTLKKRKLLYYLNSVLDNQDRMIITLYATRCDVTKVCEVIKSCFSHREIPKDEEWKMFLSDKNTKGLLSHLEEKYSPKLTFSQDKDTFHIWCVGEVNSDVIYKSLEESRNKYKAECCTKTIVAKSKSQAYICNNYLQDKFSDIEERFNVKFESASNEHKTGWIVKGTDTLLQSACSYFEEYILANIVESDLELVQVDEIFMTDEGRKLIQELEEENGCSIRILSVRGEDSQLGKQSKQPVGNTMKGQIWTLQSHKETGIFHGDAMESDWDVIVIAKPKQNISTTKGMDVLQYHNGSGSGTVAYLSIASQEDEKTKREKSKLLFSNLFKDLNQKGYKTVAIPLDVCTNINWSESQFMLNALEGFRTHNGSLKTCNFYHQVEENFEKVKKDVSGNFVSMSTLFTSRNVEIPCIQKGMESVVIGEKMKVEVLLVKGDLDVVSQEQKCEVVVNTVSPTLNLTKGAVSCSILKKAGKQLQEECYKRYPDGIDFGKFIATKGYNVAKCFIFHAVFPHHKHDTTHMYLKALMRMCLNEADKRQMTSIAFPAIGTGNLEYPKVQVAAEMYEVIQKYTTSVQKPSLQKIYFVIYGKDTETFQAFLYEQLKWKNKMSSEQLISEPKVSSGLHITYGKITLHVTKGDVTVRKADGLIIFWTSHEMYLSPLNKSYFLEAGQEVLNQWHEKRDCLQKQKKLLTDGGELKSSYKLMFHKMTSGTLSEDVVGVLQWLKMYDVKSIVIPFQQTMDEFTKDTEKFVKAIDTALKQSVAQSDTKLQRVEIVIDKDYLYDIFKQKLKNQNSQMVDGDIDDHAKGAVGGVQQTVTKTTQEPQLSTSDAHSKPRLVIAGLKENVEQVSRKLLEIADSFSRKKDSVTHLQRKQISDSGPVMSERNTTENSNVSKTLLPPEEQTVDRGTEDVGASKEELNKTRKMSLEIQKVNEEENVSETSPEREQVTTDNGNIDTGDKFDIGPVRKPESRVTSENKSEAEHNKETGSDADKDQEEKFQMKQTGHGVESNQRASTEKTEFEAENGNHEGKTDEGIDDEWMMVNSSGAISNAETAPHILQSSNLEHERKRLIVTAVKNVTLTKICVEKEFSEWISGIDVIVCPFCHQNEAMIICKSAEEATKLMEKFKRPDYQLKGFSGQTVVNLKAMINSEIIRKAKENGCWALFKDVYTKSGARFQEKGNVSWIEGSLPEIQLGFAYLVEIVIENSLQPNENRGDQSSTGSEEKRNDKTDNSIHRKGQNVDMNNRGINSDQLMIEYDRKKFEEMNVFVPDCFKDMKKEWSQDGLSVKLYGDIALLMEIENQLEKCNSLHIDEVTDEEYVKMKPVIDILKREKVWCYKPAEANSQMLIRGENYTILENSKTRLLEASGRRAVSSRKDRQLQPSSDTQFSGHEAKASHNAEPSYPTLRNEVPKEWKVVHLKNKISVFVYVGDILKLQTDCIVNAANESLSLNMGISNYISNAAGRKFQDACKTITNEKKLLKTAESVATTAGNLNYRIVIHTVGPRYSDYWLSSIACRDDLAKAIKNCLLVAHKNEMKAIGIPAVSSGSSAVPLEMCAESYALGVHQFVKENSNTSLKEIHFALKDNAFVEKVWRAFDPYAVVAHRPTVNGSGGQSARPKVKVDSSEHLLFQNNSLSGYPRIGVSREGLYLLSATMSIIVYTGDITKVNSQMIVMFETKDGTHHPLQPADGRHEQMNSKMNECYLTEQKDVSYSTANRVFHAVVIPLSPKHFEQTVTYLRNIYTKIFRKADEEEVTSIAIPFFICDSFDIGQRERLAQELRAAVISYWESQPPHSNLRSIHVVTENEEYTELVKQRFLVYIKYKQGQRKEKTPETYV